MIAFVTGLIRLAGITLPGNGWRTAAAPAPVVVNGSKMRLRVKAFVGEVAVPCSRARHGGRKALPATDARTLVAEEEEGSVPYHSAADRTAELILSERWLR